jgi:ketosteroid isomerase-like protein
MIDRDRIGGIVREAYAARQHGDTQALIAHFAPRAIFRLAGDASRLGSFPAGPIDAATAMPILIDGFRFDTLEHLHVLIDGQHAAVHNRIRASILPDGPQFETEVVDLLTFDEEGRITELVEFADTGAIAHMAASGLF